MELTGTDLEKSEILSNVALSLLKTFLLILASLFRLKRIFLCCLATPQIHGILIFFDISFSFCRCFKICFFPLSKGRGLLPYCMPEHLKQTFFQLDYLSWGNCQIDALLIFCSLMLSAPNGYANHCPSCHPEAGRDQHGPSFFGCLPVQGLVPAVSPPGFRRTRVTQLLKSRSHKHFWWLVVGWAIFW